MGDRRGLNPRPQESQSCALPAELRSPCLYVIVALKAEALTPRLPALRSPCFYAQLSLHIVRTKGVEPLTHALEGRCSIQLSYVRYLRAAARLVQLRPSRPLPPELRALFAGVARGRSPLDKCRDDWI